jgi:hypothetical protein
VITYPTFHSAIVDARAALKTRSQLVHPDHWQGVDVTRKPEMATHELLHHSFGVKFSPESCIESLQADIGPNLPWAENHFLERVCGVPINPGVEWKNWPYGLNAQKFLDEDGKFNHNYMERYWPKNAGKIAEATETRDQFRHGIELYGINQSDPNSGIRYDYGDLNDVVKQLADDPYTRQAYLPVWFPEDTGGGKRAPCTLGYHFIMRNGLLDVTYYIRSCDYLRHFRDDVYLTARLAMWILEQIQFNSTLQAKAPWGNVRLGRFYMHITSLHIFKNDWAAVFPE